MTLADRDEQRQLIQAFSDSARNFLHARSPLTRLRDLRNTSPGYERAVWLLMAEAGWNGLLISEDEGGLDLGLSAVSAIAREVGKNPMPEPYLAAAIQPSALLNALEPSSLRSTLLQKIASGEEIIGVAWQSAAGSTDLSANDDIRVHNDGETITITGTRQWVYPADADSWLVVCPARNEIYWLPGTSNGLIQQPHFRLDGTQATTLSLDDTKVDAGNLLAKGPQVATALQHSINVTRLAQSAELIGIAEQTFDLTLDYLKTRVQFGQPIGKNQALQHRMVDSLLHIELSKAVLNEYIEEGIADIVNETAHCARVKARCAQTALHITRLAIQFHGAIGYTDELDIGLYLKRALHLASWLGGVKENQRLALQHTSTTDSVSPSTLTAEQFEELAGSDWNMMPEDQFRAMVRHFVQTHYPDELQHAAHRLHWHEIKDWYLALSRQGWIAPAWPKEYGGMGLEPGKLIAFIEEMEAHGVARTPDQGIINIGPVLIRYGTPAQRDWYLPKIISGEHVWCQGYSEPEAGSDLASLRTEAILDGDEFVVTGQKTWTTLAQDANHIFLLVRTDKTVKKQAGISFLLVEMDSPGITVRPIENIAGEHEFCEVFFDQVRVPKENLVSKLNQGWTIAKALLGFERLFVGSPSQARYALNQLRLLGDAHGLFSDPSFTDQYAKSSLDVQDLGALYSQYADIVKRGEALPPSVSLLKIWATETYSRIAMETVEAAQEYGADDLTLTVEGTQITPSKRLYNSAITTIYGGTNEVQRNILAKHVLGLPT